jgi:hypothetical protein
MKTSALFNLVRNRMDPIGPIDARLEEPAQIAAMPEAHRRAARDAFARDLREAVLINTGELPVIRVSCDGSRVIFHVRAHGRRHLPVVQTKR